MTQRRLIIRRVGVLSVGKMAAALYGAIGLLFGLILTGLAVVELSMGGAWAGDEILFGVLAFALLPIVYGGLAALAVMLGALVYNLAARYLGGIEIQADVDGSDSA